MTDVVQRSSTLSPSHSPNGLRSPRALHAPKNIQNRPSRPPRTASLGAPYYIKNEELMLDPDEYFTKHTVAEVKNVLNRLRSDADAKQEELRLMVGERYRDLLQASTSIISISKSSQRVLNALEEMKKTVTAEHPSLRETEQASLTDADDAHLRTLQSLAAHLKLLLDASEHLWRLLERRRYLQAAWLFLLSRVVYRSLMRDDAEDEQSWENQGINVLEQFPLIQRQWDTVSQFRTQISHKTTLSLREHSLSAEEVCASLFALHLLDSLPLMDSLIVFLRQRTRTLHSLHGSDSDAAAPSTSTTGKLPETVKLSERSKRRVVREVWDAMQKLLDAITNTVGTARHVFQEGPTGTSSMMAQTLTFVQSDSPTESFPSLPLDLQLTTPTLLTTLPSSTHLLLLPPNIKSYKPFVDLSSPSTVVVQMSLTQKLSEWFGQALTHLKETAGTWFDWLETVKDVWEVRSTVYQWLSSTDGLEVEEKNSLRALIDGLCDTRVEKIWKMALLDIEAMFEKNLQLMTSHVGEGSSDSDADNSPVSHLLSAPPAPTMSQMGSSPLLAVSTFQKYKIAIKQRADGRTPLLDRFIWEIESGALRLRQDLEVTFQDKSSRRDLIHTYGADADRTAIKILEIMESTYKYEEHEDLDALLRKTIFVGRTAQAFSSSSFVRDLGCQEAIAADFCARLTSLYNRTIDGWRLRITSVAFEKSRKPLTHSKESPIGTNLSYPTRISPALLDSLLFLADSIQHWGIFRNHKQRIPIASPLLRDFVESYLASLQESKDMVHPQALWDVSFLKRIAEDWGADWSATIAGLDKAILQAQKHLTPTVSEIDGQDKHTVEQHFSQVRNLLSPLLPPHTLGTKANDAPHSRLETAKHAAHSPLGTAVTDHEFQPAMDLAKPSPRFGLLLVGSSTVR